MPRGTDRRLRVSKPKKTKKNIFDREEKTAMNGPVLDAMVGSSLVEVDRETTERTSDLEAEDNLSNQTVGSRCWQIDDRVDSGSSCSLE